MDLKVNNQCLFISEKLTQKLALFEEMLKLTQELETNSPNRDAELFNKKLKGRQALIDKIEQVDKELRSAYEKIIGTNKIEDFDLEFLKNYISNDLYINLASLSVKLTNVILEIQALDERYRRDTEMASEETKTRILRIKSIRRNNQLYQKNSVIEPRLIDKKR